MNNEILVLLDEIENEFSNAEKIGKRKFDSLVSGKIWDRGYDVFDKSKYTLLLKYYLSLRKGFNSLLAISKSPKKDLSKFNISKSHLIEVETRLSLIRSHLVQVLDTSERPNQEYLISSLILSVSTFLPEISYFYSSLLLISNEEGSSSWDGWSSVLKEQQKLLNKLTIESSNHFKKSEQVPVLAEKLGLEIENRN